jgi:hypothetical protein
LVLAALQQAVGRLCQVSLRRTTAGLDFIAEHELLPLLEAAEKEGLVILWICVSSCLHDETEIKDYQAAHDIAKPLNSLTLAEQDAVLAQICRQIKTAVGPSQKICQTRQTLDRRQPAWCLPCLRPKEIAPPPCWHGPKDLAVADSPSFKKS